MKVIINFSKRWLYTLIAIGILAIIGVGVYAVAGVSHNLDELNLPSCSDGQVLGMSGGVWSCADMPMLGNLKTKVIEIGDWNMDTDMVKNVAHGLTIGQIRSVDVIIINDAADNVVRLQHATFFAGYTVVGYYSWDATNIIMGRVDGEMFDSIVFDATSYNRGWVYIVYEE